MYRCRGISTPSSIRSCQSGHTSGVKTAVSIPDDVFGKAERLARRDEGRLARLERAGVIRRARRGRIEEILRVPPPAPEPGGDIVAAILDERRSGR